MAAQPEIRILNNAADMFQAAADEFAGLAHAATRANQRFTVALSGGSTPKSLYTLLASRSDIPWKQIYFFFGDERHVPPDHPESNYRMAHTAMLAHVPPENVFRVRGELADANAAALGYEQSMRTFFRLQPGEFPRFDLTLLGLGPDGHTASLFPGSAALHETQRLVVANWVEKFNSYRITFTYPVLNHSACVLFLASGTEKAHALHEILEGSEDLPAKRVRPTDGRLIWMSDRDAASGLSGSTR
ncbi:MAG: 6-phosphogluconolactonase [Acidobacteriia bacterium]|nr:6-phosphogluconolactonase [Terriglobia bacterium]